MSRHSPITGQEITNIVGSAAENNSFKFILKYDKLDLAPHLGDLLIVEQEDIRWVARVENQKQVSLDEMEQQVKESIVDQEVSEAEQGRYLGEEYTIRLVGILTDKNVNPVIRIYPNRAAKVRYPKKDELQIVTSLDKGQENIAYLGDYAVGDKVLEDIKVKLSVSRFLKRRTAILGQAGFGKSNLIKSVMAEVGYYGDDTAIIIFDIDGEYSFRTEQSLGLADIRNIRNRLVVFTSTERNEKEYEGIIASKASLNLKDLSPQEVVQSLFPAAKRITNYAAWLLSIRRNEIQNKWHRLIDLISQDGSDTDLNDILNALEINSPSSQDRNSASALRTLLNRIIYSQHDKSSQLISGIENAVNDRRIVIVDLSRMPLDTANGLVEVILNQLFRKNEEKFVKGQETIPMLIMVEEAQNFLSTQALKSEDNIVVRIAKEGRKYGFGLIYITQQPSAIDDTILSQTNNFFVLHLLTKGDIRALTDNNPVYESVAHYIQNEPLRGFAYFYSNVYSEDGKIQPTTTIFSSRIRKFDNVVKEVDEKEPRKKWESLLHDKNRERDEFMKVTIKVIDDLYVSDKTIVNWSELWRRVDSQLPQHSPYKGKYKTNAGNLYPDKAMINVAENKLMDNSEKTPYLLQKQDKNHNGYDRYNIIKQE